MPTPENPKIPDWAQRERQADLNWIRENLHVFWPAATAAFEDAGRGAIVVDTTVQPIPGAGNPFAYFPRKHYSLRSARACGLALACRSAIGYRWAVECR